VYSYLTTVIILFSALPSKYRDIQDDDSLLHAPGGSRHHRLSCLSFQPISW
jgi:hypothetical protein